MSFLQDGGERDRRAAAAGIKGRSGERPATRGDYLGRGLADCLGEHLAGIDRAGGDEFAILDGQLGHVGQHASLQVDGGLGGQFTAAHTGGQQEHLRGQLAGQLDQQRAVRLGAVIGQAGVFAVIDALYAIAEGLAGDGLCARPNHQRSHLAAA